MAINVVINGAQGKMGSTAVASIANEVGLKLVATADQNDDLACVIQQNKADVVIDFTTPTNIFKSAQTIITNHARPVIGTTGLDPKQIQQLQAQCKQQSLGGIIAPNFSLSAVLMMRYAADAAQYLPHAEIIEMHNPNKKDAPSGTAKKTAEMMIHARKQHPQNNIPIHSVRLPGLVAHQMVIFGGENETLTIRHDSLNRNSFMPGVFLSCRKVMDLNHLVYGLEKIL